MKARFFVIVGTLVAALFLFHGEIEKKLKKKPTAAAPVATITPTPEPSIPQATSTSISTGQTPADTTAELMAVRTQLPTSADLQKLTPEETHHTPEIIMNAGRMLGEVLEKAEQNPERRDATLHFFLLCAEDENTVPQVRALCWSKLVTKIPEWNLFVPVADAKVSEEIKNLAAQLQ